MLRFVIIGLGSMGKRRIRCLQALGYNDIIGFDNRGDRNTEAEDLYAIKTVDDITKIHLSQIDALIISTPPDKHIDYLKLAVEKGKPAFVEASVIVDGLHKLNSTAKQNNVLIAPSCTLCFHPAIKDIKNIVLSGTYGNVTNFSYHSGQYLPDWHPWEEVKDFYVSNKETGGGREILPFELTWIVDVIGYPENITGFYGNTMDVGAKIDDTYVLSMRFKQGFGSMVVDVASRYATRNLILNMEYGQIVWRWDEDAVKLYDARNDRWIIYKYTQGNAAAGYNKNITEDMYIEEIDSFVKTVTGKSEFPNSLEKDICVLELLIKAEKAHEH